MVLRVKGQTSILIMYIDSILVSRKKVYTLFRCTAK